MKNYSCRLINFQRFCQCCITLKMSVFEILKVTERTVNNNNIGKFRKGAYVFVKLRKFY